ncbi:cupin [candidate division LCP-89 bacterium B3_LCP]|uniref:Cupin n=1 Tax=candidate division LCP-89 bacterium B3_LCP TaxID=2012998 RepID=A0A532UZM0_UNCL8|nr:MAG: cupin [candidate division LCP-89 bacterium B3_LCP]
MLANKREKAEFAPIIGEDIDKVEKAVLIGPQDNAPNFFMRHFKLSAGGHTPYHKHDWEHVVYILSGEGKLRGESGYLELKGGTAVIIQPDEIHQFWAADDSPMEFLCMVPKYAKG